MRRMILLMLAIGSALLLSACSAAQGSGQKNETKESVESAYHKITAEEAKDMMDQGGVTVVDVRTQDEYAKAHIADAVLLPNESIGDEQPEELPDQEATILVYCRTGVRSKQASDKLVALGYQNIYDFGGIVDWPYDTVSEEK